MNSILEKKLQELENANDYECWYLVKQPTAFDSLCYLVSFLKDYQEKETPSNKLEDYISSRVSELKSTKPNLDISNNYRSLRVAAFFGLIRMTNTNYQNAIITETFYEVTNLCNGEYEKTDLYQDIIQRQIEKMFISSSVDEEYKRIRQDYRLYPVMLLYKVLLETGRSSGKYFISMSEYRYLVATTKKFENFLDTLLLIKLFREDTEANKNFEKYKAKFDNRLILALKQLPTIDVDKAGISLKQESIDEVAYKVFTFESNPSIFTTDNYLDFLGSKQTLFNLPKSEKETQTMNNGSEGVAENILLYGVPGCGKSHTIKTEYCNNDLFMERAVFHPDYTYSDFVGQILPRVYDNGSRIEYPFVPGPFTRILKKAVDSPDETFYLVIEELNRGNAPAIFGDVFQLLDRDKTGCSEYGVSNENIAKYLYPEEEHPEEIKIRIPSNLFVLATMNSSDQNVFTLDTAFKRRWTMMLIENNILGSKYANRQICAWNITWGSFAITINHIIEELGENNLSNEDNRLGAYFVGEADLTSAERFAEKVLMYLWDDAFKFDRDKVFKPEYKTLDKLIEDFVKKGFAVFLDTISFEEISDNTDKFVETENPTIDQYLEGKNPELIGSYRKLFSAIKNRIPNAYDGSVGSLGYATWKTNDIRKASFADVVLQRNRLVIWTEIPESKELIEMGEQLQIDNHHNHYFRIDYDANQIEQIVNVIEDAYKQLKAQ